LPWVGNFKDDEVLCVQRGVPYEGPRHHPFIDCII
jgi:hypothetical protein